MNQDKILQLYLVGERVIRICNYYIFENYIIINKYNYFENDAKLFFFLIYKKPHST